MKALVKNYLITHGLVAMEVASYGASIEDGFDGSVETSYHEYTYVL